MDEPEAKHGLKLPHEPGTKESIAKWQKRGHEARFAAAWQMVIDAELAKGKDPAELRMKKNVHGLIRRSQSRATI